MEPDLTSYFQMMIYELQECKLEVIKVPSPPSHDWRNQSGCGIKVRVNQNPSWYRDLCKLFPKSRSEPRRRGAGYIDTRVYRSEVLPILKRLAAGKPSTSQFVPHLTDTAIQLSKQYLEEDVEFYNEHGFWPEPFYNQF